MDRHKDDTSLYWREEETLLEDNNTQAWFTPVDEEIVEEHIEEKKKDVLTTYFEKKKKGNNTDIPVEPEPVELCRLICDYENWEGRVVSMEENIIRARIKNTQRIYSPRMLQISKTVFAEKGISKALTIGDMFEITFKRIRFEFQTKEQKIRQREENIDTIKLVEQVRLSRQEIDAQVSKELQALSYLFE